MRGVGKTRGDAWLLVAPAPEACSSIPGPVDIPGIDGIGRDRWGTGGGLELRCPRPILEPLRTRLLQAGSLKAIDFTSWDWKRQVAKWLSSVEDALRRQPRSDKPFAFKLNTSNRRRGQKNILPKEGNTQCNSIAWRFRGIMGFTPWVTASSNSHWIAAICCSRHFLQ